MKKEKCRKTGKGVMKKTKNVINRYKKIPKRKDISKKVPYRADTHKR